MHEIEEGDEASSEDCLGDCDDGGDGQEAAEDAIVHELAGELFEGGVGGRGVLGSYRAGLKGEDALIFDLEEDAAGESRRQGGRGAGRRKQGGLQARGGRRRCKLLVAFLHSCYQMLPVAFPFSCIPVSIA